LPLMEQVVHLVELDPDLLEPADVRSVQATAVAGLGPEHLLLSREGVDPVEEVFVSHVSPTWSAGSRGRPWTSPDPASATSRPCPACRTGCPPGRTCGCRRRASPSSRRSCSTRP